VTTPTEFYRRTDRRDPDPLPKGVDAWANRWIGAYRRRTGALQRLRSDAAEAETLWRGIKDEGDHRLRMRLQEQREIIRRGGRDAGPAILPALALVREAAHRQLGLLAFPEQLMGALALHRGCLAEMATGEGKTLTAGIAAVLMAWNGRPCHVITVNDYLVERDARWLDPLYRFCGIRAGFVTAPQSPEERRDAYASDITYATSKEVVADFLRDALRLGHLRQPVRRLVQRLLHPADGVQDGLVMRGLHSAIIDEADSILIDEAVTPLIISAPHTNEALKDVVRIAQSLAEPLEADVHYSVDPRHREIELTAAGNALLEEVCAPLPGFWRAPERRTELIRQALVAREFYLPGRQYVVVDGKVVIVDEFTGRQMAQRTWRQGLHQAVEAKEGIGLSDPSETIARISFQRYFRFYHRLAGMTGTAREAAAELWQTYGLPVLTIPPHRPNRRIQIPDLVLPTAEARWEAVVDRVKSVHARRQPILIGTRSVAASERLAELLDDEGIGFQLLNAVRHQEEATVVAMAGEAGRITIATNMAGRGTDIRLGHGVAELGGLHVIATERHESGRVDRQLFGRNARQGDPGSAQAILSTEDDLLKRHLPAPIQEQVQRAVVHRLPGAQRMAAAAMRLAQSLAQRKAEGLRTSVSRMDTWIEESLSFTGREAG
jgi:preprotein translocase subunit SecA